MLFRSFSLYCSCLSFSFSRRRCRFSNVSYLRCRFSYAASDVSAGSCSWGSAWRFTENQYRTLIRGGGTNVFCHSWPKPPPDAGVLVQLRELGGLDELLLAVRRLDFRLVEVAAIRVGVDLGLERGRVGGGGDEGRVGGEQESGVCGDKGFILDCGQ